MIIPKVKWSDIFDLIPLPGDNSADAPLVLVYKYGRAAGREACPSGPAASVAYKVERRHPDAKPYTVRMSRPVKKSHIIWEMRNGPVLAGYKVVQLATGNRNRPQPHELRCVPESHPEPKRSPRWATKPNKGDTP